MSVYLFLNFGPFVPFPFQVSSWFARWVSSFYSVEMLQQYNMYGSLYWQVASLVNQWWQKQNWVSWISVRGSFLPVAFHKTLRPRHMLPKMVRMLIFDVWSESPSKTYVVFRFIKHRFCINIACMFLVWLFLLVVHVFSNQLLVRLRHCMFVRLRHCMFTCLTLFHAECSFSVVCQAHGLKAQDPLAKAQGAHGTWAVCLLPIAHELCYGAHQMCPFILPITQPTNSAH